MAEDELEEDDEEELLEEEEDEEELEDPLPTVIDIALR